MTTGPSFEQLCSLFVASLLEKAHAFVGDELTQFQRSRLAESMTSDIRKLGDMAFPAARTPLVSTAAKHHADAMGADLLAATWHSQKKIDGYKTFTYEHLYPVRQIRVTLTQAATIAEAMSVLDDMLWVAWITKEEDLALRTGGFVSFRDDPFRAYGECGITLLAHDEFPDLNAPFGARPRLFVSRPAH
jgi:hypothetical protein